MTPKHTSWLLTAAIIVGTAAAPAGACGLDPGWFARQAVSDDPRAAESAIAALRRLGPAGLDAFVREHADSIASARVSSSSDPRWERVSRALDAIGRQHDNHSARLYWYTDLERAKAASGASGKPILSLRLLGRLDEELSCANSRFIRTALYANEAISARLRDQFVLHWSSQRPAPRITIDFGDGRSIVRTITGNSIHYLLDAEGRPLDALPGFYGPKPFLDWLERAETLHRQVATSGGGPPRARLLRGYHDRRFASIVDSWKADLEAAGHALAPIDAVAAADLMAGGRPGALEAAGLTMTKAAIEVPLLWAMASTAERLGAETTSDLWPRIAALHREDARLDRSSLAVMVAKTRFDSESPQTSDAPAPAPAMVERFERSMALDSVRNEYLLHRAIHEWFVTGTVGGDLDALNDKVYTELFATPKSDPWLGLLAADTYAALQDNGVVSFP